MPVRHGVPERTFYFHVTSARDQMELIDWTRAISEARAVQLIEDRYDDDPTVAITSFGTTPPLEIKIQIMRAH